MLHIRHSFMIPNIYRSHISVTKSRKPKIKIIWMLLLSCKSPGLIYYRNSESYFRVFNRGVIHIGQSKHPHRFPEM